MLLYEMTNRTSRTAVIYPGRFQPFHPGHMDIWNRLNAAGGDVWIATSDKTEYPRSPFGFEDKRRIMIHAGVPAERIALTSRPYLASEILDRYDPNDTTAVFVLSEKDRDRFSFAQKDGSPTWHRPWTGPESGRPFSECAYIMTMPVRTFSAGGRRMSSSSEVRQAFAEADVGEQAVLIRDMYGRYDRDIHALLSRELGKAGDRRLDENASVTPAQIRKIEVYADRLFGSLGIDVEFTRHFLDRVNDARNRRPIMPGELARLFRLEYERYGVPISRLGDGAEAVMRDMRTDVNVPFVLDWDSRSGNFDLIAKTVMRKNDFRTRDPVFAVEGAVGAITDQNTTADVKPGETRRQAAKFGLMLDKDGRPPLIRSRKRKRRSF